MKHNWKHIKFGDAFNLQMGKTPARANSAYWSNGLYDWVSISDMPNGKYIQGTKEKISQKAVDETGIHLVKKGTALMSFKLTIGKTAIAPYDLYTNEAIMAFEPKEGIDVLADFLYYYLQLYKWTGNRAVMGNTTNKGVIANSYASIPSLDEQQAIVRELDGINRLIDLQEEQLREYDRLAQAIFVDMFGNPLHNDKRWETKNLGDLSVKIANGYNAKLEPDTYKAQGIPYFRCQNIWWNRIDASDLAYIDEQTNEKMKSSSLKKNDLIISKIGRVYTENSSLGRTAMYEGEDYCANLSGNLCFVRLKDTICPKFVLSILTFEEYRKWAMKNTPGGIDKRAMSVGQISKFPIILPPLALQQTFAAQIEAIEQQKALIRKSLDGTRTLLAARMQYYFE